MKFVNFKLFKIRSIWVHCLECFNPKWFSSFFIIRVTMVNYLNMHVINCSKSKKWEIIFSCISPQTPWLCKSTFHLYWLNLSLNLVNLGIPVYWRPHTVQDIKYITSLLLPSNRKFISYVFILKLLDSFPGTRILQIRIFQSYKLPVVTSYSGFNVDLTKWSFKGLA